jgi:hypothetical protein
MDTSPDVQLASPAKRFFFARIFPWPFLLVGLVGSFIGCRYFVLARLSSDWPSAKGLVFTSRIEEHSDSDGTTFHAKVAYSYEVAGVKFSSDRVAFGDYGSSDPEHAQEIVNRYPVNSPVVVHYKPDRPRESVLEVGVKAQAYFLPLGGFIFAAVGGAMIIYLPRIIQKPDQQSQGNAGSLPTSGDSSASDSPSSLGPRG